MDKILCFPKLQTVAFSNALIKLCHSARTSGEDTIIFDLSKTTFITPFGLVLLAGTIAECQAQNKKAKYRRPDKSVTQKFLSTIGFNKFFKIPSNGWPEIASANVQLRRLQQIDYFLTDQILQVFGFSLHMTKGVEGSLKLALNELMTNVFDHSESVRGCYVCAQRYSLSKKIRLCIADFGIGFLAALRRVPKYNTLRNDYAAIELAVREGITSRIGKDAGYGLAHIQRFIKVNQGKMYILSGKGKILWDYTGLKYKERNQTMHDVFQGAIIELEINAKGEGLYFLESEAGQIF
jgi:anti-anti-sigma regulatory factor/anti-sigma regulatory factor (Ser/Thr protein kinase)